MGFVKGKQNGTDLFDLGNGDGHVQRLDSRLVIRLHQQGRIQDVFPLATQNNHALEQTNYLSHQTAVRKHTVSED